jgi:hypothetical protein
MRKLLALFALVLVGGILAACGDDSGSDTLSEAEFQDQANAICEDGNAEIDEQAEEYFEGTGPNEQPSAEQAEAFAEEVVVPGVQGQIDDIRALEAPEDVQDDLDAALDDAEAVVDEIAVDPTVITSEEDPFEEEVFPQLEALGLDACTE